MILDGTGLLGFQERHCPNCLYQIHTAEDGSKIYRIEHLNSRNGNAVKNHYLLTRIADILMQLYLAWNLLVKETGQSIKNVFTVS